MWARLRGIERGLGGLHQTLRMTSMVNSRPLWKAVFVLAAAVFCGPMCASAQAGADSATLRIQLLDGRTGRPVTNQHLAIARKDGRPLEANGASKKVETTDGEGYAPIPNTDVALDRVVVYVDRHRPCSKAEKREFSLVKVRASGVVSENSCRSRITLFPQAGTLVFFVREETFLERIRH